MTMKRIRVAIVYRSTTDAPGCSHAGLGICAINSSKTLNQHKIHCHSWPVVNAESIITRLRAAPDTSHVVIQAPWVATEKLFQMGQLFPDVQFLVNCHSNVGFLQAEPEAMKKMLELVDLEQSSPNLHCGGNSEEFCNWVRMAYQAPCTCLPNLYHLNAHAEAHRPLWNGGLLRIGIFGAPRPQKNVLTGVAGAIEIAQSLKAQTEIWVNAGRDESHGKTILKACRMAIDRNPFCTYKEFPWAPWPEFRRHVSSMNLLIQASYTESFNQVTADGIATGVPSVVSPAIRWAPKHWMCDVDSANSVAHVGRALITSPYTQRDGLKALREHNYFGLVEWKRYLSGKDFKEIHP